MFIRNCWYVAAFSKEIVNLNLFSRTICDIPMVFYRVEDSGKVVALFDACPHRFFPLSKGQVTKLGIQCGYHGMQFGSDGTCLSIPGQKDIPPGACVKTFPIVEKNNLVWVWPGDPELADESKLPAFEITDRATSGLDFSCFDSPDWLHTGGEHIHVKANYRLIVDNLLDLSHADFIHRNTIGSEHTDNEIQVNTHIDKEKNTLHHLWLMSNTRPPHLYTLANDIEHELVDFWLDTHLFAPSTFILEHGITESGRAREKGVCLNNINALTPETETTTHYFWIQSLLKTKDKQHNDKQIIDLWRTMTIKVFAEDEWALAEQKKRLSSLGIENLMGEKRITLESDRPSVLANNLIKRMEQQESKHD